jgi:fructokinase
VIVVCGEALIDLVPVPGGWSYLARPGGSPANVAVGLGRLGVEVSLLARLSSDAFGRLLRSHLSGSHVDLTAAVPTSEPSTLAVVTLDHSGNANYAFYLAGTANGGWQLPDLPPSLPDGAALHVSGALALAVPTMGDTLEALLRRERGRRVLAFDPNVRPLLGQDEARLRARLDDWLSLADIVKVSSDDLSWIAPEEPVAEVAARWRGMGPALVVVTMGREGVHALGPAGPVDLPAASIEVVDTVGAGDAFMSGLLAALEDGGHLDRDRLARLDPGTLTAVLGFAQLVAARTCQRDGADPPWRSQLEN